MRFVESDSLDGVDAAVLDAIVAKYLADSPEGSIEDRVTGAVLDGFLVGRDFVIRDVWVKGLRADGVL